ncbi:wall-associated receptor kinase-like 15 isoform X2 [Gossypium australe]|uniref:non-specific serine/threonine protein kinase n=1 Tax=Gossypium australe TaxID=47621 RepID=A0A5B6U944_9ROSI|nr:wall-associated receptor kinase-like 15 isoform X2 [Gossypium australe]
MDPTSQPISQKVTKISGTETPPRSPLPYPFPFHTIPTYTTTQSPPLLLNIMQHPLKHHLTLTLLALTLLSHFPSASPLTPCRTLCGTTAINYPFSIDDGCGAPQYRSMLNCTGTDLFFMTTSGRYKVQSIDYNKQTMLVYDPAMSTCSILQPHHDFVMTDVESVVIPPSSDTVFALLNCSIDSPVLNRYKNLCFNFSGHSCDELYSGCNAFRVFRSFTNSSPPCCFTGYDTVKYMSMNILDCSHYTSFVNVDGLKGIGPADWVYGMKLSYAVPDTGCGRCTRSGGACGYDTETGVLMCLCSTSMNATRECGSNGDIGGGQKLALRTKFHAFALVVGAFIYFVTFI